MRRSRTVLTTAATLALGLAVAAPASAATNPYTAEGVCGPGFSLARSIALKSGDGAVVMGWMKVLFSPGSGRSCGVLMKARQIGRATQTSTSITKTTGRESWKVDSGAYAYYAGPLYVKAEPRCVRFGGAMSVPDGRKGFYVQPDWASCPR